MPDFLQDVIEAAGWQDGIGLLEAFLDGVDPGFGCESGIESGP